jgi:hypothetical protein
MKKIFKSLLLLWPVLCACSSVPYDEKLRYQLIQDYSKDIQKKKNLTMIAIGGGQQGRLFVVRYSTQQNVNLEQARELLVDTCEGFLKRVNNDQKFRPYMLEYPYNDTNIDISIRFGDSNNDRAKPPYIAIAANQKGKVYYYTSNIKEKLVDFHAETYEEACEIVKGNQN